MKRIILFIILLIMPFMVYAENCETNKVTISNISLVEYSDSVVEVSDASIDGNSVNLNLKMKELDDSAKYKITIKNDSREDYEIDNNTINSNSEYITYELKTEDNINIIKSGTSKDATLVVTYKNEIPENIFTSDKYNDNQTLTINLSSENEELIETNNNETIINPKTGYSYVFILIMCIIGFSLIYLVINKSKYSKFFILLILLLPIYLNAMCKVEVKVESNIEIEKPEKLYLMTSTTAGGTGAFFRTNITKQEVEEITFTNDISGRSTDSESCFDVSYARRGGVFAWLTDEDNNGLYEVTIGAKRKIYVYNGNHLFANLTQLKRINGMEYIDTSEATNMSWMFYGCNKLESLDISSFNTSNVTNMSVMFQGCSIISGLDFSHFDTSKVTAMHNMFYGCRGLTELNLSSFDTSLVTDISGMFALCSGVEKIYVSDSFVTNLVTSSNQAFYGCNKIVGGAGTTWKSSNSNDVAYAHIDGGVDNPGYFTLTQGN